MVFYNFKENHRNEKWALKYLFHTQKYVGMGEIVQYYKTIDPNTCIWDEYGNGGYIPWWVKGKNRYLNVPDIVEKAKKNIITKDSGVQTSTEFQNIWGKKRLKTLDTAIKIVGKKIAQEAIAENNNTVTVPYVIKFNPISYHFPYESLVEINKAVRAIHRWEGKRKIKIKTDPEVAEVLQIDHDIPAGYFESIDINLSHSTPGGLDEKKLIIQLLPE